MSRSTKFLIACIAMMWALPAAAAQSTNFWVWSDDGDSAYVYVWTPRGLTGHAAAPSRLAAPATASLDPASTNVPLTSTAFGGAFEVSVPDGDGGAIVVWMDDRGAGTGFDIFAQHLLRCGIVDPVWPADGVQLTDAPGNDEVPVAASDGSGGAYISWSKNFNTPSPTGPDVFATHLLGNGTVHPAWPTGGLGVAIPGFQRFSQITPDGNGGAYLVWDDRRNGRQPFIQHLVTSGIDPAWPTNGLPVTSVFTGPNNNSPNPRVCSDGAGGAIVAWDDPRNSTPSDLTCDIYAQRVSPTGSLLWPGDVPVTRAPAFQRMLGVGGPAFSFGIEMSAGAQSNPIVADGSGGCFVTWADDRNVALTGDVYAQHLTSAGTVAAGWPADGQAICTAPNRQMRPVALADGAGGAFVTWLDDRPEAYVQHVTGAGVVDGPTDGLALCGPFGTNEPVAVSDGAHGAILIWGDGRNLTTFVIYAQHLKAPITIDSSWPVNGAQLSPTSSDGFTLAAAVSDDAGGAVAVWGDDRPTPHPGYEGQRILANGQLQSRGGVSGRVTANCPAPNTGLLGVTVDAYQVGSGDLVATAATDATGAYFLSGLSIDHDYMITVVTPLGYAPAAVEIEGNPCSGPVDFNLSCLTANGTPRSMGYWKHEVGVATGGNGHGDFSAAQLCSYLDLIAVHFNSNLINQVIVYQPPASGLCADKLVVARNLLNLQGSVAMIMRARQQLLSLLLNVAAGQISQTRVISADGATVSQAITYSDNLIDNPTGDYEKAKTICDMINNGQQVPAGMIPLSTQNIEYARRDAKLDFSVRNPGRGILEFHFTLGAAGPVELNLYDLAGRLVRQLADGPMAAGSHVVQWNRAGAAGNGLCFARLRTGDKDQTLKVLVLDR